MIRFLRSFNWLQFAAILALVALGTVSIKSAGEARSAQVFHEMWISNLGTATFGLVLYFLLAKTDYRRFFDLFSAPIYLVSLLLLVIVLLIGTKTMGGRRWLWFFQPSEISKFCILSFLASVLGHPAFRRSGLAASWRGLLLAGAIAGVPGLLILLEPDLGTMLTLVPAVVLMLLAAGVWRKGLVAILLAGLVLGSGVLAAVYEAKKPGVSEERAAKILKWVPLKAHQVKRVKVFLFPDGEDAVSKDQSYNLRQALIAIGSGGFVGKGVGKGETNHLKYLPPSVSMNDFIFCVYAEERGYLGSLGLLALYAALLLGVCWTAARASDLRGRLFALGFAMLVFAHVYVNIGMSLGLVPITGLPLPFISSGRTFLVTLFCGLGVVQSVALHADADDETALSGS